MLEALVFFTFIAGVFCGIGITGMALVLLVNKHEKEEALRSPIRRVKHQMEKVQEDPSVPQHGPILN